MISPHPSYSMLYRTQNHLPLAFKPPHSSPSLSPHLLSTTIYSQGMELPEPKSEDMTSEEMFVDELLDFSSGFSEPEVQNNDSSSLVTQEQTLISLCGKDAFAPMPEPELALPEEGLESLEWLSHFVEDSFSEYSLTGKPPPKPLEKPALCLQNNSRFAKKARTKRARTGIRVWPVLSSDYGSSSPSSSTSSTTTTSFPPPNYWAHSEALFLPVSIVAKRKAPAADGGGAAAAQPRRCTHCGVTKTPQWRAGPLGSKTLCNACGVRFKSGRLLPEYRPACSPTFSSELHSNNHRKVLEMRQQKEVEVPVSGPVQG